MFKKILVANRGEIALRVIRTAKRLGISTVAIYSDVDKGALHVGLADEAVRVGGNLPSESYLNIGAIVAIARSVGAEGIHPGYGFLSENSHFAQACAEAGITFVGPDHTTLETTGNKIECKRLVKEGGVPVIPSSLGAVRSPEEAVHKAEEFGYPVLLKSAFGGGGRGIREARTGDEVREGFERAEGEARNAFGRAEIYVEKLIKPARHIEVQILSDGKGTVIHLGERECSIQRRHQKLIELAPSPAVDERMRRTVGDYAIRAARAVRYLNSGTVEFLLDPEGNFHFMEVNSRLQVEHPVTEAITGVDLVAEQFAIASGDGISLSQEEVRFDGMAMECRINAEDPLKDFAPDVGTVGPLQIPGGNGVRVDSAIYEGWTVPEFYDSLLAKLIVWGRNFPEVRTKTAIALSEFRIGGVKTTIPLYRELMEEASFRRWSLSTDYLTESGVLGRLKTRAEGESRARMEIAAAVAGSLFAQGIHRSTVTDASDSTRRGWPSPRYYDAL